MEQATNIIFALTLLPGVRLIYLVLFTAPFFGAIYLITLPFARFYAVETDPIDIFQDLICFTLLFFLSIGLVMKLCELVGTYLY